MRMRKSLGILLAILLLVSLLPGAALAEEDVYTVTVTARGESVYDSEAHGKVQINDRTPTAESDSIWAEKGTDVTITAIPDAGYRFAYWIGPGGWYIGEPGETSRTITVNYADNNYTACFISTDKTASAEMADIDLGFANEGYTAASTFSFYTTYYIKGDLTVKNTGEAPLMPYGFTLDEEGSNYFRLGRTYSGSSAEPLQAGHSNSWYWIVYPKEGLSVGTYTATVTMTERCQPGLTAPVTATVTFEVTEDPIISAAASPANGGTATGGGRYHKGDTVTLTATPNEHFKFLGWSDGATENPYTFTADESQTVNAVFEQYEYQVGASVSGSGGKVQIDDRTPTAGSDSVDVEKGTEVTITAIPDDGYRLAYWIGPGGWYIGEPGETSRTITVGTSNVSYNACFVSTSLTAAAQMEDIDLGVASEGYTAASTFGYYTTYYIKGALTVKNTGESPLMPYGFTLDEEGSNYFRLARTYSGSSASPLTTGQSNSWYWIVYPKEGLSAGTYTATVTFVERCQPGLTAPLTANVTFTVTPKYVIETSVAPDDSGTVEGAGAYEPGAPVTLTATASDTYAFDHWERGSETSTENPYTFTAEKTETVTAVFERTSYKVTIAADPAEGGAVSADAFAGTSANMAKNTLVTVTANANPGYRFKHWKDNGKQLGTDAAITVNAILDHNLVAYFEKLEEGAAPESVSLVYNGAEQTAYADTATYTVKSGGSGKAAGTYTAVLTLKDGAVWNDMTTADKTVSWTITQAPVTAHVVAADRAYEAGNKAVVLTADYVGGVCGTDKVTLDLSAASGAMTDDGAGSGKAVTVAGVKLGGADAANYKLTGQPTGVTVNIVKAGWMQTTASGGAKYGESGSLDLAALTAPGGVLGAPAVTAGSECLVGEPSLAGSILGFTMKNTAGNVGRTATVSIPVTGSANYEDYTIAVTLTVGSKEAQSSFGFASATAEKALGDADFTQAATGAVSGSTVTYKSSDPTVATVSDTGLVHLLKAGVTTVTATASATADYAEATAQYTLTVNPAPLTGITITTKPTTAYVEGETFDASGMVVTAAYADGTSKAVGGWTFDKTGPLALTDTVVTVSYTEDGVTKTATVAVTVSEKTPDFALSGVVSGGEVSYTVTAQKTASAVLFAARYEGGRLIAAQVIDLALAVGDNTGNVTGLGVGGTYKLFLADKGGMTPLCPNWIG